MFLATSAAMFFVLKLTLYSGYDQTILQRAQIRPTLGKAVWAPSESEIYYLEVQSFVHFYNLHRFSRDRLKNKKIAIYICNF